MAKAKLIILSTIAQYQAFTDSSFNTGDFTAFVDNARLHEFLNANQFPYEILDEFLIADRWSVLNVWGCSQAADWIELCRKKNVFKDVDLASVLFLNLSKMLIQAVKNYSYAKLLLEKCRPSCVVVFDDVPNSNYPEFSGNFYLNYFLKELSAKDNIEVQKLTLGGKEIRDEYLKDFSPWHKKIIQKFLVNAKQAFNLIYGYLIKPRPITLLATGSLTHLGSTLVQLVKKGANIALYDFEYHWHQHRFALTHQISYWIPYCFSNKQTTESLQWVEERLQELFSSLDESKAQNLFQFDQFDFCEFVRENIFAMMKPHFQRLANKLGHYKCLVQLCSPSAVLLNDDFSTQNSFLAAYLKTNQVKTFCISHANLVVDFAVSKEHQAFGQSTTFVNSDYEKTMWQARGWKGKNIVVTGTPRYDRLMRMHSDRKKSVNGTDRRIKLLYCASGLWLHSPNQRGYLGSHVVLYGQNQIPRIRATLNIVRDLPVKLIIKPHSDAAVPMWKNFVSHEKSRDKIQVTEHSEDIFALYGKCDAMVVPYWSTAMIETAMIGLPTIFLDMNQPHSPSLYQFAEQSFCRIVHNETELKTEIESLLHSKNTTTFDSISRTMDEYFLGKRDASSSLRVANYIQLNLFAQKNESFTDNLADCNAR